MDQWWGEGLDILLWGAMIFHGGGVCPHDPPLVTPLVAKNVVYSPYTLYTATEACVVEVGTG